MKNTEDCPLCKNYCNMQMYGLYMFKQSEIKQRDIRRWKHIKLSPLTELSCLCSSAA